MHSPSSHSNNKWLGRIQSGAHILESSARFLGAAKGVIEAGRALAPVAAAML